MSSLQEFQDLSSERIIGIGMATRTLSGLLANFREVFFDGGGAHIPM